MRADSPVHTSVPAYVASPSSMSRHWRSGRGFLPPAHWAATMVRSGSPTALNAAMPSSSWLPDCPTRNTSLAPAFSTSGLMSPPANVSESSHWVPSRRSESTMMKSAGSLQADERVAVPVEQVGILRGHGAREEAECGLDLPGPQDAGHRAGDAHILDAAAPVDAKEGALGLLARIAVDQQGHVSVRAERLRQRAGREALAHAARSAGHERRGGMPLSLSHTSAYAGGKPRGAAA